MKFRSRISIVLIILIIGIMFFPMLNGKDLLAKFISLAIPFVFVLLTFSTINYTISNETLIIRTFWYKMATIRISRIQSIRSSYNPLSSPAASLRRLEIKFYHNGKFATALISPIREAEFISKLKEINPNIKTKITHKRNILRFWDWDI